MRVSRLSADSAAPGEDDHRASSSSQVTAGSRVNSSRRHPSGKNQERHARVSRFNAQKEAQQRNAASRELAEQNASILERKAWGLGYDLLELVRKVGDAADIARCVIMSRAMAKAWCLLIPAEASSLSLSIFPAASSTSITTTYFSGKMHGMIWRAIHVWPWQ